MRTVGYCRVSTDKQADRGVSLEAQTEKIKAMAVVQGVELAEMIVDAGESAKSLDRPGLQRLLAMVAAGEVKTVIVAKLDRLTRSVKDLADLLESFNRRAVALVSIAESLDTQSAAGRLVLNVMTAVSQWEREAIGERTRDAMAHKKAAGQRVGTLPFGFGVAGDGVHLVEDVREQEMLRRMNQLRDLGLPLRRVAEELNRSGFRTRRGTEWGVESIHKLIGRAA
ncbi:MAG: recombinase family protein [Acidobacteria bacterium]|nr:recombinase family protein [Acidobacteriota bacterium]